MQIHGSKDLQKLIFMVNKSELASLKNSIIEIIRIVNNPRSTAKQLTEIIELDPPLTAKILRVANSPYFSAIRKIADIRQAIVRIGFDTVKELTLSQKVCELFKSSSENEGFSRIELWKHSVAVAMCGKTIFRREFGRHGSIIFTAGILHDIGIVVEEQYLNEQFSNILKKRKMMRDNIYNAEEMIMHVNHCTIAEELIKDWGLPDNLYESITNHHNPEFASDKNYTFAATLYIADYLIQKNSIGFSDTPFLNRMLYEKTLRKLNLSSISMDLIIDEVKMEINKMENDGWFDNV